MCSSMDSFPSAHVAYNGLTRESKKRLQEALHQWALWHSKRYASSHHEASKELLESGSNVYSPFLQFDYNVTSTGSVPVWMDRPTKKMRKSPSSPQLVTTESQELEDDIPLYDRACNSALLSQDSATDRTDGFLSIQTEEVSRCFNCGSYSHALKDCSRPRDNAAINNARKLHSDKKGLTSGPRISSRYYQSTPGGKFEDIKPGVLGIESRQSLGIGELDPPPWLHRMRELGYPPGYIEFEDVPSGVEIIGDEDEAENRHNLDTDDGVIRSIVQPPLIEASVKKLTVEFPGINAPIPENSDRRLWEAAADFQVRGSRSHQQVTQSPVIGTGSGVGLLSPKSPRQASMCTTSGSSPSRFLRGSSDSLENSASAHKLASLSGGSVVNGKLVLTGDTLTRRHSVSGYSPSPLAVGDMEVMAPGTLGHENLFPTGIFSPRRSPTNSEPMFTQPQGVFSPRQSPTRGSFRSPSTPNSSSPLMFSRPLHFQSPLPQLSPQQHFSPNHDAWAKAHAALGALHSNAPKPQRGWNG